MPSPKSQSPEALEAYRKKRQADGTGEPFGRLNPALAGVFVVQQHAARRLHWDLRLEMDGVLKSWAIPRGPSADPAEKRLAVRTEDHPIDYQEFEGVIPDGNYGAGAMIVWDRGTWIPIVGPEVDLEKGKLLFELRGYKLRGVWTLFKTSRKNQKSEEWMLVKKPDGWARDPEEAEYPQHSVLSGLTVEELREGGGRVAALQQELSASDLPRGRVDPRDQRVMLAEPRPDAFSRAGWLFELKYDGFRLLATKRSGKVHLYYRRGSDATHLFPDIARAVAALPADDLILDGEVVVLDAESHPSFSRLQQRTQLTRALDIQRAAIQLPATYFAFDLLSFEDHDLRGQPLTERKRFLQQVVPPSGPLRFCDHIEERGEEFFKGVEAMGLEGVVAKRAVSTYSPGRSSEWQKIRVDRREDFVIVGYTVEKTGGSSFAALHLGQYQGDDLQYSGRVGSGFSDSLRKKLDKAFARDRVEVPAVSGNLPKGDKHVWVTPRLVCEVRFKERTRQGQLRHPSLLGMRPDKIAHDAVTETVEEELDVAATIAAAEEAARQRRVVRLTNPDKVYWPEDGYTKGDLVDYYRTIGPFLLPYLRDRPLVLTRYPDGIHGKNFFQKNAPEFAPEWVRTETLWSEGSQRDIEYFICEDLETLEFIANLGSIVLHLWSSRLSDIQNPDWCILDLDPKEAPFSHVVKVAKAIHKLCAEIDLPCFAKTSGSTGIHVLLPLAGQCNYEQSRILAELVARVIAHEHSKIATTARVIDQRDGKVYIDYGQNGHGRLLVAPYSLRPQPGAPASAPLRWSEVNAKLSIDKFTLKTLPTRMKRLKGGDPLLPVMELRPDLGAVLSRLGERMAIVLAES